MKKIYLVVAVVVSLLAGLVLPVAAAPTDATLTVQPAEDAYLVNDEFVVVVNLNTTAPLYGAQATLTYNPAVLTYVSVQAGDIFTSTDNVWLSPQVNTTAGTVTVFPSRRNPAGQFTGTGVMVRFRFRGLAAGDSTLVLSNVRLANIDGEEILPVSSSNGLIHILGTGTLAGQVEVQGRTGRWNGAVVAMTHTVWPKYSYVTTSDVDGNWAQAGMATGSYTVTVEMARYLDAEKDGVAIAAGATTTLARVKVLGGDVDENDIVDISDVSAIGGLFGQVVNPVTTAADINADAIINIFDLVLAAGNYDKHSVTNVPWP